MKIKNRHSIEDVYSSLSLLDLHCEYFGIAWPKYKKIIQFDADIRGNGRGPYLELKFFNKYVKIHKGTDLSQKEKKMIFKYSNYDNVDDFSENLAGFIIRYFKSFGYVRNLKNKKL